MAGGFEASGRVSVGEGGLCCDGGRSRGWWTVVRRRLWLEQRASGFPSVDSPPPCLAMVSLGHHRSAACGEDIDQAPPRHWDPCPHRHANHRTMHAFCFVDPFVDHEYYVSKKKKIMALPRPS